MTPEENSGNFLAFSIGAMEFIDAERVRSNQETVFFHQNDRRVEWRALGRPNLIFGAADSVFVKMDERVVHSHPHIAIYGINAKCGKNLPKRRRLRSCLCAIDGFACR